MVSTVINMRFAEFTITAPNKIYNIKVRSLDDITVEQLAEYKVWSQKAVDYLKYLYKLQEKLTIEQY